jgi:hypothetical protein
MRCKIKGRKSIKKLRAALHQVVDDMEQLGITHADRVYIYFAPVDEEGAPVTVYRDRRKLEEWSIKGGYEAVADEYDPL